MIKKFNEYFLLEKLGISDEVSKLTNFILNNLENKDIIILKNNLPNLIKKKIINRNINIKNKIDNYEKYFNKQGNFMFKKLTKIYGLLK